MRQWPKGQRAYSSEKKADNKQYCTGSCAGEFLFLNKKCDADLQHGNGRCESRNKEGEEEEDCNDTTDRHLAEHIWESFKYESRSGLRIDSECKHCRHYGCACYERKHKVRNSSRYTLRQNIVFFAYIRRIRHDRSESERKRKEGLTERCCTRLTRKL